MNLLLSLSGLLALLIALATAQDLTKLCTVSPSGCTIGATACPTGCIKSARCQNPCPPQKTTVVTYTSRTTVTTAAPTSTITKTSTKAVTTTPSVKPATCASQVPYINLFTFEEQGCSTLVDADRDLLCLLDDPQANFTFSGPPNKINSPFRRNAGSFLYTASECVELAVPDSRSAYFTIDGDAGTNVTKADCRVTLFARSGCQGVADSYNIRNNNTCLSIPPDEPAWLSADFECSRLIGPEWER